MTHTKRGEIVEGVIVSHHANPNQVRVRLPDGSELDAVLAKSHLRGAFGALTGWKVRVALRQPPKMHRVFHVERNTPAPKD